MVERRKPIVTELALADALDQLVNLIEELQTDVALRMEITTDETELVKLVFSGTPDAGFCRLSPAARGPLRSRRDRSPYLERGSPRLRHPVPLRRRRLTRDTPQHAHSEPAKYSVTPDQSRRTRHHQSTPVQPRTLVGHAHDASNLPGNVIKPTRVPAVSNDGLQVSPVSLTLGNASFPRSSPTRSRGVDQDGCE